MVLIAVALAVLGHVLFGPGWRAALLLNHRCRPVGALAGRLGRTAQGRHLGPAQRPDRLAAYLPWQGDQFGMGREQHHLRHNPELMVRISRGVMVVGAGCGYWLVAVELRVRGLAGPVAEDARRTPRGSAHAL